ncbi:MAG: ComEC/Rec2 family competence protein [Acidimicrobiia bacterium]
MAILVLAGFVSGLAADARSISGEPRLTGSGHLRATVIEDPQGKEQLAVVRPISWEGIEWDGPPIALVAGDAMVEVGDTLEMDGRFVGGPRRIGPDIVAGTFRTPEVDVLSKTVNPILVAGNALRLRVRDTFDTSARSGALLVGFLVGDTDDVSARDLENLRRSGLSHFVAVSGSNVALFLAAWWLVGIPLSISPRTRAVFGIVGLLVFVVATRWEPSVVRAAAMAAVPLVGGLVGVPTDPWVAIGVAASALLLVSADLLLSLGFQLSVLATVGVMLGVSVTRSRTPRWLWTPLGATIGAQLAVAPLIVAVFGSIPLAAPLANLVAAPVVALSTTIGMAAVVLPVPLLATAAQGGGSIVLAIAEAAESGPQLDLLGATATAGIGFGLMFAPTRPLAVALAVVLFVSLPTGPAPWPATPRAVALDVGQGDAILVQSPSGATMLVDGGRDPLVLDGLLRSYGVSRLDIVVATHGDADHVGGLMEVFSTVDVGQLWVSGFAERDPGIAAVKDRATDAGVVVVEVSAGRSALVGDVTIEVLSPNRRYLSDNDGSVVLRVAHSRDLLLGGDIEGAAQHDLPAVHPDVLVVPHHGSSTNDLRWLERTVQSEAVLSYGSNTYGHPHDSIVELLTDLGVAIRSTSDGDVVIPLSDP